MPDPPDNRRTSDEYRTWNDDRLDDLAEQLRALAPLVTQVGVAQAAIDTHADEMRGVRRYIRDVETRMTIQLARVEQSCTDFHDEYRADRATAAKDRQAARSATRQAVVMVLVAIVGAAGVIVAAIISAGGT